MIIEYLLIETRIKRNLLLILFFLLQSVKDSGTLIRQLHRKYTHVLTNSDENANDKISDVFYDEIDKVDVKGYVVKKLTFSLQP